MFILLVCVLTGFTSVQSRQIAHSTGVESCVYTFNVPRDNNTCPPGSMEPSEVGTGGLKQTMETQHSQISKQLRNLTQMISELHRKAEGGGQDVEEKRPAFKYGTHYTRWGHSACPCTASLLYTGYAGKSFYSNGGGMDYQCLPMDPEFPENARAGYQSQSYMYGVEYEKNNSPVFPDGRHDNDVPCAVCHVDQRGENIMIPAKVTCPRGWTKEYEGLLMAQLHTQRASNFVCVDKELEVLPGSSFNHNGGLLYAVEVVCGALSCPPYKDGFELTCVVCTL